MGVRRWPSRETRQVVAGSWLRQQRAEAASRAG